MPSRNQIRQIVIQFLYAVPVSGVTPQEQPALWELLLAPTRAQYLRALAKAVTQQLIRNYGDAQRLFLTRWNALLPLLQQDPLSLSVRDYADDLDRATNAFLLAITALKKAYKTDEKNESGELGQACTHLQTSNTSLLHIREQFLNALADLPAYQHQSAGVIAAGKRLQHINMLIQTAAQAPTDAKTPYGELGAVINARKELDALEAESRRLAQAVLDKAETLDQAINNTLQHYSPERVSALERAILRLASYEILYTDLEPVIAIAQAIDLTKRYSAIEALPFVNGVLAGVAANKQK